MVSTSLPVAPTPFDSLDPSEASLVRAARHNPAAFAQLYRAYLRPFFGYTLARVGNGVEAEDLTSQTFLAAFEGTDRFRGDCRFSTWLFGIASHKCSDLMRRNGRTRQHVTLKLAEGEPLPCPQIDELVEGWVQMQAVASQLDRLPPDQAEAVSLRVFGGLSAAEAGEVMGKSEAAVKMLVYRAVREVRSNLADWMEKGPPEFGSWVALTFIPVDNQPRTPLILIEKPLALVTTYASEQTTTVKIGRYEVTVTRTALECTNYDWDVGDLHLSLANSFNESGTARYSCEQMAKIIESIR